MRVAAGARRARMGRCSGEDGAEAEGGQKEGEGVQRATHLLNHLLGIRLLLAHCD